MKKADRLTVGVDALEQIYSRKNRVFLKEVFPLKKLIFFLSIFALMRLPQLLIYRLFSSAHLSPPHLNFKVTM